MPRASPPDDACVSLEQLNRIWVMPANMCGWSELRSRQWHAIVRSSVHKSFQKRHSQKTAQVRQIIPRLTQYRQVRRPAHVGLQSFKPEGSQDRQKDDTNRQPCSFEKRLPFSNSICRQGLEASCARISKQRRQNLPEPSSIGTPVIHWHPRPRDRRTCTNKSRLVYHRKEIIKRRCPEGAVDYVMGAPASGNNAPHRELHGAPSLHVDDLLMAGFEKETVGRLWIDFQVSSHNRRRERLPLRRTKRSMKAR